MIGRRPRTCRRQLPAALLTGLAALLVAGAALAAGGSKDQKPWPRHVQVTEARLALKNVQGKVPLPQLRAYDRGGRLLYSSIGYSSEGFEDIVNWLLTTPDKRPALGDGPDPDRPANLAADLARLETPDGRSLPRPPAAELTLVKYWAAWCVPCQAQSRDLAQFLAAHPGAKVSLIHVDADLTKRLPKK